MYTHCPHCRTTFRIYPDQLVQARGQVRCGVCSYCFNALESLSETPTPPPIPAAPGGEAHEYREHAEPLEQPAPVAAAEPSEETEPEAGLDQGSSSETIVEPLPGDEVSSEIETPDVVIQAEEEPAAPEGEAFEHPEYVEPLQQPAATAPIATEESIEETTEFEAGAAQDITSPESVAETLPGTAALEQEKPAAAEKGQESATPLEGPPERTLPDLGIIAAEPRPMAAAAEKAPNRLKTALWAVVNVILILTLMGQYTYYNRNELAQYPELQPWLAQLCGMMSCDTPLRREVSRIALTKRIVESHPSRANALLIDATLVNQADFPQPYPLLEIRFSDLNNQLVAGRRFRPSEYLPAGTSLEKGMPPHQPVHIVLEIVDPGKDAVSFLFDLL